MTEEEYYIKKYEIMEWSKCYSDPKYFIENYVIKNSPLGQRRYQLYPHQKDMIDAYLTYDRVIGNVSRQCGTTSTTLSYILWYIIFNGNRTVAVATNSHNRTASLIDDLLVSYYLLPDFLKPGLESKSRSVLSFKNQVTIRGISVTDTSARGLSMSLLYVDDAAFCKDDHFRKFMYSVWPCISTQNGQVILTSAPYQAPSEFYNFWCGAVDNGIGNIGSNGFFPFQVKWNLVPDRDDSFKSSVIGNIGPEKWAREFDCQFDLK